MLYKATQIPGKMRLTYLETRSLKLKFAFNSISKVVSATTWGVMGFRNKPKGSKIRNASKNESQKMFKHIEDLHTELNSLYEIKMNHSSLT